jgi:hypothetical protein
MSFNSATPSEDSDDEIHNYSLGHEFITRMRQRYAQGK